jgi:lipopolysaccharide transport system permease protein
MEEITIEAGRNPSYWKEFWHYRSLIYFLAWRDIVLRYKQTVIGVAWAIMPSLVTTGAFTLVFGKLARLPSGGEPYAVLVLAGALPWNLIASAIGQGGSSLVNNSALISKIYFPRLVVPVSAVLVSLIDFVIGCILFVGLMFWYHLFPGWRILALPLFFGIALCTALGAAIWLSALNVRYRDFRYLIPFLIQIGLFLSPVGFSTSIIIGKWRTWYSINPVVGVIDGFRWVIFGSNFHLRLPGIIVSAIFSLVLLVSGYIYFRHVERTFADVI